MNPVRDNKDEKSMLIEQLHKVVQMESTLRFTDVLKKHILSLTG